MNTTLESRPKLPTNMRIGVGPGSVLLVCTFLCLSASPALAITNTWDGGGANNNWTTAANWNGNVAPVNGNTLLFPTNVADLNTTNDFSAGSGLTVEGLLFQDDYTIRGNQVNLSNRIVGTSFGVIIIPPIFPTLDLDLRLITAPVISVTANTAVNFTFNGDISLGGSRILFTGAGHHTVNGVISGAGSAADVQKQGSGTLRLQNTNTFAGDLLAEAGYTIVNGFVSNAIVSGASTSFGGTGRVGTLTVNTTGSIRPGADVPGILTVDGNLTFGSSGSLRLDLDGITVGTGYDQILVGGPTVNLNSTALVLDLAAGFFPAAGTVFTIISNSSASAISGTFAGLAEGAVTNVNGVEFQISYVGGSGNDVTLTVQTPVTRIWTGGGPDNLWTTAANWNAPVSEGDALVFPGTGVDVTSLTNTNDFAANTVFSAITFSGTNYNLTGALIALTNGIHHTSGGTNTIGLDLQIEANQSFRTTSTVGHLQVIGDVDLTNHTLTNDSTALTTLSGVIHGTGGLVKTGTGNLKLSGNSNNTYSGLTTVLAGTLALQKGSSPGNYRAISGDLIIGDNIGPASNAIVRLDYNNQIVDTARLTIHSSGLLDATGDFETIGSFGGSGVVHIGQGLFSGANNDSTSFSGRILGGTLFKNGDGQFDLHGSHDFDSLSLTRGSVIFSGTNTGSVLVYSNTTLTAQGSVGNLFIGLINEPGGTLRPGQSPGVLRCNDLRLSSQATLELELNGTTPGSGHDQLVVTGGVTLSNAMLNATVGFASTVGDSFTIIENDAADVVTNTFAGLPEGTRFSIGGSEFRITYAGGSGNDVVLTHIGNTRTWDGGGADNLWTTAANWDAPVKEGDALILPGTGVDATSLTSTNDFPPKTLFSTITISGTNYNLRGELMGLTNGIHHTSGGTNTIGLDLQLYANQTFHAAAGTGHLQISGDLNLISRTLTNDSSSWITISGVISGTGDLVKIGTGTLKLSGNSNNTYSGLTTVLAGTLALGKGLTAGNHRAVSGDLIIGDNVGPASNAIVRLDYNNQIVDTARLNINDSGLLDASGDFETIGSFGGSGVVLIGQGLFSGANNDSTSFSGRILGGALFKSGDGQFVLHGNHAFSSLSLTDGSVIFNGTNTGSVLVYTNTTFTAQGSVGNLTMGIIDAGGGTLRPGQSPGVLRCNDLRLSSQATLEFELNGPTPGSGHDQLVVTGGVTLSNATLNATLKYASTLGTEFVIIQNDGTDAITNIFNGRPEGAILTVGGEQFRISYLGGDGNDVSLNQISANQLPVLSIEKLSTTSVRLLWPTNGSTGFNLQTNASLTTGNWADTVPLPVVTGTNQVVTNAIGATRFYRLHKP